MALDDSVMQAVNFVVNTPWRAFYDIGSHLLAGYFISRALFPDAKAGKTTLIAIVAGLAPDFDYATFGAIAHKTITHTFYYGGLVSAGIYFFTRNHERPSHKQESIPAKAYHYVKDYLKSKYAQTIIWGVATHIGIDALKATEDKRFCMVVMAANVLIQHVSYKALDDLCESRVEILKDE